MTRVLSSRFSPPPPTHSILQAGLRAPELIRLDTDTKVSDALRLAFFTVRREEKAAALVWVLRHVIPEGQQAIVFASTRHHVELLTALLGACGLDALPVYGKMDMSARTANLARFRARRTSFLIVTDVAARGLDLPLLDNVVNYDFPDKPKLFVHRCGRVARQGRVGTAFSLVAASDMPYMLDVLLVLGRPALNTLPGAAGGTAGAAAGAGGAAPPRTSYTLEDMTADDVHYGQIPRTALEPELEGVRGRLTESAELAALLRSSVNAVEQYNKVGRGGCASACVQLYSSFLTLPAPRPLLQTRAEASRTSVARAREIPDDRVHPLLQQVRPPPPLRLLCNALVPARLRSAAPVQFAAADESALRTFIAGLATFRPAQTILETDSSKATRLEAGARVKATRAAHARMVTPRVGSVSLAAAGAAAARGNLDLGSAGATLLGALAAGRRRGAAAADEEGGEGTDREAGDADDDDDDGMAGAAGAAAAAAAVPAAAELGRPRMSAAMRRRLKSAAAASTASSGAPVAALPPAAPHHQPPVAGVSISAPGDPSAWAAGGGAPAGAASLASLPKSERRRLLRAAGGAPLASDPAAFHDPALYVSLAPAAERLVEAAYSQAGTLAAGEGHAGREGGGADTVRRRGLMLLPAGLHSSPLFPPHPPLPSGCGRPRGHHALRRARARPHVGRARRRARRRRRRAPPRALLGPAVQEVRPGGPRGDRQRAAQARPQRGGRAHRRRERRRQGRQEAARGGRPVPQVGP